MERGKVQKYVGIITAQIIKFEYKIAKTPIPISPFEFFGSFPKVIANHHNFPKRDRDVPKCEQQF